MNRIVGGQKPDLPPLQIAAILAGGIPIFATLLRVFGVYDLNDEQIEALKEAVNWGGILAIALIGGDVGLRAFRNLGNAKVEAAALTAQAGPPDANVNVITNGTSARNAATAAEVADFPRDELQVSERDLDMKADAATEISEIEGPEPGDDFDLDFDDDDLPSDEEEFADAPLADDELTFVDNPDA